MKLNTRFQTAAALPFVLLLVALNVTVVVALLVYATTELQASRNSGQTEAARAMAQSGIDLATGLIAANSTNNGFVTYQRVTNVGGAARLETRIANVMAPDPAKPWQRTAVNPAVLHSGFASGTSGVDLNFSVGGDPTAGFIAPRTNLSGWTNLSPDMFRMEWIYVYKSGSTNPVGRFAYWVDDESTKLNINYSGTTNAYDTNNYKNNQTLRFYIKDPRPGTMPTSYQNFELNGRIWPIDMELGGIAGLSTTNAYQVINWRGQPRTTAFRPYPSVLGLRIGTIGALGGIAVTNIFQQSALAFTATAYSSEEERSYATGRKRYDMLYMQRMSGAAPNADAISLFQSSIVGDNPKFASKYNLPGLAWNAYSLAQIPGSTNPAVSTHHPAEIYGTSPLYVRALPLLNELSIRATATNNNGTNVVNVAAEVELILLSQQPKGSSPYYWGDTIADKDKFEVSVELQAPASPEIFGSPIATIAMKGTTNAAPTNWFQAYSTNYYGPMDKNLVNALAVMSASIPYTNTSSAPSVFPTNAILRLKYDGKLYQTVNLGGLPTPVGMVPPASGQTNIYHIVAQPRGDSGYRGDPRFGTFASYAVAVAGATNSTLTASPGQLNTSPPDATSTLGNWRLDEFGSDANHPDLVASAVAFAQDKGLPNYSGALVNSGFSQLFAGNGWIGEVPVASASRDALAFSTPRLWGDGRPVVNGVDYPPDWLLLDSLHMGIYTTNATGAFPSFGRVNVNGAKTFFQTVPGSLNKSDTIMDSVLVNARTRDYNTESAISGNTMKSVPSSDSSRTNLLTRIKQMTEQRNAANNPYVTHFEFLADLAATNISTSPDWWFAPTNSSGSIYSATNTTDRRIEGVVRSLNQKLTTHGNQFSIFSLGQALQVVNGKTNIVGEAYLQSVYERAPAYNEASGAITNSPTGAPPMRQLYLRELRY